MYNNFGYPYMQTQTPQNSMIDVRSEDEVLRYPVAPGNSVSFRNVTEPYIYTKTMTSQFGQPVIEKYRLVKEGTPEAEPYARKADLDALAATVGELMRKVAGDE